MPTKPHPPNHKREQSDRFVETARELGCDEDETAFEEKLKKIAKRRPKPAPEKG
jgi:hypothetical protein